jgi:hypothetical protein
MKSEVLGSLWLMASATWKEGNNSVKDLCDCGRWAGPLFSYIQAFLLKLRKNTENFSQGSRIVRN